MAGGFFNPENGLFRYTEKLVDLFFLSVFWVFCSLPVFTLGPATAALYNTVRRTIRGSERNGWVMFFRTFAANFKVGALTTLVALPVGFLLLVLHELLYRTASISATGVLVYAAYCVFLLLPIGVGCYLFPVLSRFTFGVGGLISTCAKLAVAHLPSTVAAAVVLCLTVSLCSILPVAIFVLPAVVALIHSLLFERIFRPYIRAQLGEDDGGAEEE